MDNVTFANKRSPAYTYESHINAIAFGAGVPPCALAAIVEIESGGRNVLQEGMPPGEDCGVGLCQITYGVHWAGGPTYKGRSLLIPEWNLTVAARDFIAPAIASAAAYRQTHATSMNQYSTELLYFAFAIYNAGSAPVLYALEHGIDPDKATTDHYAHRALAVYHTNCAASHVGAA